MATKTHVNGGKLKLIGNDGVVQGFVNGEERYRIVGKEEVWISALVDGKDEFVARFKYGRSKRREARHFLKFLHENIAIGNYLKKLEEKSSPIGILKELGYIDYGTTKLKEGH